MLDLPPSEAHTQPLSDTAVSALFGHGNIARTTLINAWLEDGIYHMKTVSGSSISDALKARLKFNESVVQHLPEVLF